MKEKKLICIRINEKGRVEVKHEKSKSNLRIINKKGRRTNEKEEE